MSNQNNKKNAKMFQGADHWTLNHNEGEKKIRLADGPNGLRIEKDDKPGFNPSYPANCYPTASCIACSFDEELLYTYGQMLGEECQAADVDVLLGPGINHKRSPECGRNFEYYSEDPLLSGKLGAAYIRGVQSEHTGTCLKHLAANNREKTRLTMDSIVDERTLHELYLRQFEIAVKEGKPASVMPAYNKLNGVHCCENKELLDEVRSYGFDGIFISDWGAVSSPEDALKAGLNLEMPGNTGADELLESAVKAGTLRAQLVDQNAAEMHQWISRFKDHPKTSFDQRKHERFLLKAAEESAVLLKNDHILPLRKEMNIAVIGALAEEPLLQGSGSSHVEMKKNENLLDALKKEHISFSYARGYALHGDYEDRQTEDEAIRTVHGRDAVIFVMGLPEKEGEGYDRSDLSLPAGQISLLKRIAEHNKNIIVVLECGAPVETGWRNNAKGILCMYLSGMKGSEACVHLLFGDAVPCGRLAETWPEHLQDVPCAEWYDTSPVKSEYRETIFSGYRYYTTFHVSAAWIFGHGLSYTSFSYSNLQVTYHQDEIETELDVKNTGEYDGKELVQIYGGNICSSIACCQTRLIAFRKVFLKKGQQQHIHISIPVKNLAYWDTKLHAWSVESGRYFISVNRSACEVIDQKEIEITGNDNPYSSIRMQYFHVRDGRLNVSDADYECMFGIPLPLEKPVLPFTADTMIYELSVCSLGKAVNVVVKWLLKRNAFSGVNEEMVLTSPIRQALWLDQHITWKTVQLMADYLNRHRWHTLREIIRSFQKH